MKRFVRSLLPSAIALALGATIASATPSVLYQAEFTGTLTEVTSSAPFWSGIDAGTVFTVTVTYDDDPTSYSSSYETYGLHGWTPGLHSLTVTFGDYIFSVPNVGLTIYNNYSGWDGFFFHNQNELSSNGLYIGNTSDVAVILIENGGTYNPITATTVDAVGPFDELSIFDYNEFRIIGTFNGGADTASVHGVITGYTFSSTPIPEPASAALLGLGSVLAALGSRRPRRAP